MAQKKLLQEGQTLKHDGQNLLIEKSLSSGLTGEVYKALLSVSGEKDLVNVVVKAMKVLDFPLARQLFYKEGETLASLMHLEEETPDSLASNLKIAPVYYGLSEYQPDPDTQGFPYLVMEFIPGTQVPELLKKQGTFSEKQALTIAWHLYRILDILHNHLSKTFIDLKFENLWWVENKFDRKWGGQLKLTDFGTLEEIKPGDEKKRGVARDVLLGGVYLLSMLTGHTLKYSIGELNEHAKPIIDRFKDKMTWGTRRLVGTLLHRNIDARFKNAVDVREELRLLASLWSQSPERLSEIVQKSLAEAESAAEQAQAGKEPLSAKGLAAATRAYSALDILRVKEPQLFNERDVQRVESVRSIGDYFERGYALLQGRSFMLARQTFEEGVSWADELAVLRRWSHAARIGEEIPPKDFEERFADLKTLLDFINRSPASNDPPISNSQKWQSARRDLADLAGTALGKPSLKSKGLDYLIAECELFDLLEQAGNCYTDGKFSEASVFYEKAKIILESRIPLDVAKLIEEETGSLSTLRRNAEEHMDREASLKKFGNADEALRNGDVIQAVEIAKQAYQLDRYAPFRFEKLTGLCLTALELSPMQPEKADVYIRASRQFADIGSQEFGKDVEFDKICDVSVTLDLALQKIPLADHIEFSKLLEVAHAALGEKGALVEGIIKYAASRTAQEPLFLEALAESMERLVSSSNHPIEWRRMASEISQARSEEYHKQVDDLMRQVYHILLPIMPYANDPKTLAEILQVAADHSHRLGGFDLHVLQGRRSRLEEAKILVDKMRKLIYKEGEYRWKEFELIRDMVTDGLKPAEETVEKQAQVQSEEYEVRKDALFGELDQIQEKLNWVKNNPPGDFESNSQVASYQTLHRQLVDYLYRCYQTKSTFQKTTELDILINRAIYALNMLGGASWKQLLELASGRIEYFESTFKQASEDFARGDLLRVRVVLDSTRAELDSTPEWQALNAKFVQARDWIAWCESKSEQFQSAKADAGLLRDLRFFSDLGLPAVYWEHSPADSYLDQAFAGLKTDLQSDIKSSNIYHEKFLDILRGLLDVTWTKQLAVSSKEQRAWKMAEWLQGAYERARSKDKNARGLLTYISQTLPPENIDDALVSFTYADWDNLRLAEKRRRDAENKRRKSLLAVGITLSVCLVLAVAGILGYVANKERISQIVNGTYTPSPTLTPTLTSTPTLTPTITLTPTETLTLTPVPPSKYLLQDVGPLYPASPINGDAYWLVNDTDAVIAPLPGGPEKVWKDARSSDKNAKSEKFVYTVTGNANIAWIMDMPFDAAGYYQIFVLDTQQYSSQPQSFNVFLDQQLVQPYRGASQVIFQDIQQKTDAWVSLGVYQANAGQTLAVQLAIGELTDKKPFAVDRLLVVRLNESTRQMLDQLPAGRPLVSLLDDPAVRFFEVVGGEPKQVKDRGALFNDVQAWNGSFTSRPLNEPLTIPVWVEWTSENRLSAGTYEVYVWIPALHATVVADYFLLADGKEVDRPNPATINQKDHAGKWLSLGTWDLPQESMVSLRMIVAAGVTGEIGLDAVAIVKVEQ
ncbi:MAG: hypothetical protein IPG44_17335 [Anaerolineales bacterium]|nr:hypothetical protein [Anaerolineales bacterium]